MDNRACVVHGGAPRRKANRRFLDRLPSMKNRYHATKQTVDEDTCRLISNRRTDNTNMCKRYAGLRQESTRRWRNQSRSSNSAIICSAKRSTVVLALARTNLCSPVATRSPQVRIRAISPSASNTGAVMVCFVSRLFTPRSYLDLFSFRDADRVLIYSKCSTRLAITL